MADITINLLTTKNSIATANKVSLQLNQNTFYIVAGEQNATLFEISYNTTTWSGYDFYVEMVNAAGYGISKTKLEADSTTTWVKSATTFVLPDGMAVAGYAYISITAEKTDGTKVVFMPIKIAVQNTIPTWKQGIDNNVNVYVQNGHLYYIDANDETHDLGQVSGENGADGKGIYNINQTLSQSGGKIYYGYIVNELGEPVVAGDLLLDDNGSLAHIDSVVQDTEITAVNPMQIGDTITRLFKANSEIIAQCLPELSYSAQTYTDDNDVVWRKIELISLTQSMSYKGILVAYKSGSNYALCVGDWTTDTASGGGLRKGYCLYGTPPYVIKNQQTLDNIYEDATSAAIAYVSVLNLYTDGVQTEVEITNIEQQPIWSKAITKDGKWTSNGGVYYTYRGSIKGENGQGVPTGGTAGQILKKKSGTDYDTEWANESNIVDTEMSDTSENVVENKVIKSYVDTLFNSIINGNEVEY